LGHICGKQHPLSHYSSKSPKRRDVPKPYLGESPNLIPVLVKLFMMSSPVAAGAEFWLRLLVVEPGDPGPFEPVVDEKDLPPISGLWLVPKLN